MSPKFTAVTSLLLIFGCGEKHSSDRSPKDYILSERNLVPEGMAVDSRTEVIYVGSTYKRKIVQISPSGDVSDFISQEMYGMWSLVGMEVDEARDILWVNTAHANEVMPLVNPDTTKDWLTGVFAFDISERKLIKKYEYQSNRPKAFFNDLTVTSDGDVFITETVNGEIYTIAHEKDELQLFLKPDGFTFLNGITYAELLNALFVSCTEGILRIDIASKEYVLLRTAADIDVKVIDGLTYYQNFFIGHQSSKVSKFYLNHDKTEITKAEVLDSGPDFDSSTTGEIGNENYYFIVNSQIRSAIDRRTMTIKPVDSLKNIIIRRLSLQAE